MKGIIISKADKDMILHCRRSFLFCDGQLNSQAHDAQILHSFKTTQSETSEDYVKHETKRNVVFLPIENIKI